MALTLSIDKKPIYIGDLNGVELAYAQNVITDITGTPSFDYKNKSWFYLYTYNNFINVPATICINIIDDCTVRFSEFDYSAVGHYDGYVMSFDYGNDLIQHFAIRSIASETTYLPYVLNGATITDGMTISAGSIIMTQPYYNSGYYIPNCLLTYTYKGDIFDARDFLTDSSYIPQLTTGPTGYVDWSSDFINATNFLEKINRIQDVESVSPFYQDNSKYTPIIGETIKIKKNWIDNISNTVTAIVFYTSYKYVNSIKENYIRGFRKSYSSGQYENFEFFNPIDPNNNFTIKCNTYMNDMINTGKTYFTYSELKSMQSDFDIGTIVLNDTIYLEYSPNNYLGTKGMFMINYSPLILPIWSGGGGGGFEPDPGTDPDECGGNQTWGQGSPTTSTVGGDFDDTSDTISGGTPTSVKAGQTYNNYYSLNLDQVFDVKRETWNLQIPGFTTASEGIIGLNFFPFNLSSISQTTGNPFISIGNSVMTIDSNVSLLNANYNNEIDFGTYKLKPYFGGFQDYAPYTKIQIYLPFLGIRDLDPQYIVDRDVNIKYNVNFSNGQCTVCIYSNGVLYIRFNGQIGQTIPLTQVNNTLVESTLGTALQLGSSAILTGINPALGAMTATSALSTLASAKPHISGSVGGGGENELSLPLECFFIIERPHCAVGQTYPHEKGRPSMLNKKLSNCKGFTSMVKPQVTATCTSEENDMINRMLKEGVIING